MGNQPITAGDVGRSLGQMAQTWRDARGAGRTFVEQMAYESGGRTAEMHLWLLNTGDPEAPQMLAGRGGKEDPEDAAFVRGYDDFASEHGLTPWRRRGNFLVPRVWDDETHRKNGEKSARETAASPYREIAEGRHRSLHPPPHPAFIEAYNRTAKALGIAEWGGTTPPSARVSGRAGFFFADP